MDEDQWLLTALEDEHGLLQAFGDVEWVVAAQVEPVRGRRPEGQAVGGCRGRQPQAVDQLGLLGHRLDDGLRRRRGLWVEGSEVADLADGCPVEGSFRLP